jgi:hypothetical protein
MILRGAHGTTWYAERGGPPMRCGTHGRFRDRRPIWIVRDPRRPLASIWREVPSHNSARDQSTVGVGLCGANGRTWRTKWASRFEA